MAINDNRIQLPPTEIDFDNDVGTTGQAHDNFPSDGQQPRYDWMRSFLIGLLSCQSSEDPPTQYRNGTIWFNGAKNAYYVWYDDAWRSITEFIGIIENTDGSVLSLADWYTIVDAKLNSVQPRVTFGGSAGADTVTSIPIPVSAVNVIDGLTELLHPLVYINGLLVDPRNTRFAVGCPNTVELLNGVNMDTGDSFVVIIQRFDLIVTADVVAT
jgi:hypothetical protein